MFLGIVLERRERRMVRQISPRDVSEFLTEIYKLPASKGIRCYRGQANTSWKPIPSVLRGMKKDAERNVISELTLEAASDFSDDKSMFRKLVRAQHYGLPTRLLDVSLNPLVALFFACSDSAESENDGKLYIFDFLSNRIKFADSDAVSVISNLANLTEEERETLDQAVQKYIANKKTASGRRNFNRQRAADRLAQFVRLEKSYFRSEIDPLDIRRYLFVHPYKDNRRIIAQSGAFIVAGLLRYEGMGRSKGFDLTEFKISSDAKSKILDELDRININSRTLFPEIDSASQYIRNKWKR